MYVTKFVRSFVLRSDGRMTTKSEVMVRKMNITTRRLVR